MRPVSLPQFLCRHLIRMFTRRSDLGPAHPGLIFGGLFLYEVTNVKR